MHSILIIDSMPDSFMKQLSLLGFSISYIPEMNREEALKIIAGYDGIVVRSKLNVDRELISAGKQLKFIARAGAGMDNIDEEYAHLKGITCFNAPEGNRDSVGEHTLGLLLSLLHKIGRADAEVRKGIWDRETNRGVELMGKTVGIIGFGNMGQSFAKRLIGFGVHVLAYDKYLKNINVEGVEQVNLEGLFERTDILSLHIPLTADTKGKINLAFLNKFIKPIYLINTARGEVLNTNDLVECILLGKVHGAGLDVLENERINQLNEEQKKCFEFLINSDRVLLSPHVAGWSVESYERIGKVLINKIKAFF